MIDKIQQKIKKKEKRKMDKFAKIAANSSNLNINAKKMLELLRLNHENITLNDAKVYKRAYDKLSKQEKQIFLNITLENKKDPLSLHAYSSKGGLMDLGSIEITHPSVYFKSVFSFKRGGLTAQLDLENLTKSLTNRHKSSDLYITKTTRNDYLVSKLQLENKLGRKLYTKEDVRQGKATQEEYIKDAKLRNQLFQKERAIKTKQFIDLLEIKQQEVQDSMEKSQEDLEETWGVKTVSNKH